MKPSAALVITASAPHAPSSDSLRASAEALLSHSYFRSLRLSSLRRLVLCSIPLWTHAFGRRLPGALVWMAILMTTLFLALAAGYGVMERVWRRRSSHAQGSHAAVIVFDAALLDHVRSGLLWAGGLLTLLPWLAGLGCPLRGGLLAQIGPLAAVVLGPAAALELLALARDMQPAGPA